MSSQSESVIRCLCGFRSSIAARNPQVLWFKLQRHWGRHVEACEKAENGLQRMELSCRCGDALIVVSSAPEALWEQVQTSVSRHRNKCRQARVRQHSVNIRPMGLVRAIA